VLLLFEGGKDDCNDEDVELLKGDVKKEGKVFNDSTECC
jgi:hypothetical protein